MPVTTHECELKVLPETKVWRYMSIEKYISLLENGALFFCRSDKFSDPFEGSIPKKEAAGRNDLNKRLGGDITKAMRIIQEENNRGIQSLHQRFRRATVVNCWQISNFESDAMWRLYLKDNEGLAVSTTVGKLCDSFENTNLKIGSSKVRYLNYEEDIWYHPVEYPVNSYNMLTPLLHKRKEYSYENEFRLYLHISEALNDERFWENQPNHKGTLVPVDVHTLVEEIILPPTADDSSQKQIEELIRKHCYSFSIRKSALQSTPVY
ncbi:DUF2971 domain-containing protein [Flavihumibacter solisilvae]|uniref:DUF2971 domain-containing protein n=1 Tax=Flavihumibacter solisilvae TaxID=1349421 RepID=A0A0C1KVE3_9BACT|nr:DUF2971 domain-containing protein [Flavihumibacter solisilvae]KIC91326.1 hypothetical protein OI18_22305 [Flavihumibacter solisilvae]